MHDIFIFFNRIEHKPSICYVHKRARVYIYIRMHICVIYNYENNVNETANKIWNNMRMQFFVCVCVTFVYTCRYAYVRIRIPCVYIRCTCWCVT